MPEDIKWLIGIAATFFLTFGGLLLGAFYRIVSKIDDGHDNLSKNIKDGDDALHERVNRVRDEYVRRADLDGHIQRLDKNVDDLRSDIKQSRAEMNQRLDALIAAMSKARD